MTCLVVNSYILSPPIIPALSLHTYDDSVIDPIDASSQVSFLNTGSLSWTSVSGGTAAVLGEWLTRLSGPDAALYELEVVITAGTAFNTVGTTAAGAGVWRDLASNWMYGNDRTTLGIKSTTATFTIRRKSDTVTMATASLTISATVSL